MRLTSKRIMTVFLIILCFSCTRVDYNLEKTHAENISHISNERKLIIPSNIGESVLYDDFNEFPGYNQTIWNLESYGNGSISWIKDEQFQMNASRHSFRTLTSIQTFEVGFEAIIRMKLVEAETAVCVGWTNTTPITEWNYLFGNSSVLFQGALSTVMLEEVSTELGQRTSKMISGLDSSVFHTYRLVWNSSVLIGYVDGERVAVIGDEMPTGPLHFKIAVTEFRNVTTNGGVIIDSITIKEHHSMISESPPFISLDSPGNNTMNLAGDPIDVTPVGHNGTLYWSWDGAANRSGVDQYDIRLPSAVGEHALDVYCVDSYGYNNWANARYIFNTMGKPPVLIARRMTEPPIIDGIIEEDEWPAITLNTLNLVRIDGITFPVDVMIASDEIFIYIAIDSPIKSGHDSRAALIVDGTLDNAYNGYNGTPAMSIWYNLGSPTAWEGYNEIQALVSSEDGQISGIRITQVPEGFMAVSTAKTDGVHYEFRLPLEEFNAGLGSRLGISIMLYPSGMGVHNLFYPLILPWNNASRLGVLVIPNFVPPVVLAVEISLCIGVVALVGYFGWKRRVAGSSTVFIESEDSMRVLELIQSYDEITLNRLSSMSGISEDNIRARIQELVEIGRVNVEITQDGIVKRK